MTDKIYDKDRRRLLKTLAAGGLVTGLNAVLPAFAGNATRQLHTAAARVGDGTPGPVRMDFNIRRESIDIAGSHGRAITVDHSVPGPLLELYEDQMAHLRVINHLHENTSIHWHGILIPFRLDGVPGVTFNGVEPGATFPVDFQVRQSGTYWYHSHSGLQEQIGLIGPIVIHPAEPDPIQVDRDYVVMLSDWTFNDPHDILDNLKSQGDYYNFNQRTVGEFIEDVRESGWQKTVNDRLMWGAMRMSPTDIADVTGYGYSYLMNGLHPAANWTGLFKPGERVRLRFINGSAMTYFNVRIPGLKMTVVAADGQNVQPVDVQEFQIAVAETFDVVVEPQANQAYTIMAENSDRSGYTRGTLAPRDGMTAPVPALRKPPVLSMIDMGMEMDMPGMNHGSMDMGDMQMSGMNHGAMKPGSMQHQGMDMGDMNMGGMKHKGMAMPNTNKAEGRAFPGAVYLDGMDDGNTTGIEMMENAGPVVARYTPDYPTAATQSSGPIRYDRLGEEPSGLEDIGHRVLVYTDLKSRYPMKDRRAPGREIKVHLTGNMERYMWSFDGVTFSDSTPIEFHYGERLRLTLVNDTMMNHPIHLHGMFMDLENGQGQMLPRKHTINVKPAGQVSLLITADERGRWAFHCHLLYHMEMGMFRVVRVS